MTNVPDFIARAIEAQGATTVDAVRDRLAYDADEVLPQDETLVEEQRRAAWSTCAGCGDPVDPADKNMLREVTGWEQLRTDGGTNHVRQRRPTGRVMCGRCSLRVRSGVNVAQEAMV